MGARIPSGSGEYCKSCFSLFIRPGTKEIVSLASLGVNWGRRRGQGRARIGSQHEEDVYEICARARFLQIFGKYFFKLVESISPVKN